MPITSSSSDEMQQHGGAVRHERVDNLVDVPPRAEVDAAVGSSNTNTSASAASHLARTTFCWLPPLSEPATRSSPAVLTRSRSHHRFAIAARGWRSRSPTRASRSRIGQPDVVLERGAEHEPVGLAILGQQRQPPRDGVARRGDERRPPFQAHASRVRAIGPARHRANSVRPAPARPASPSTSPRCSDEADVVHHAAPATGPRRGALPRRAATSRRGKWSLTSRLIISRTSSAGVRPRPCPAWSRTGRRAARSRGGPTRKISSMPVRDVDRRRRRSAARRSMVAIRRSTSIAVNADVGSSMTRMRASSASARAISTACCSARPSRRTSVRGIELDAETAQQLRRARVSWRDGPPSRARDVGNCRGRRCRPPAGAGPASVPGE